MGHVRTVSMAARVTVIRHAKERQASVEIRNARTEERATPATTTVSANPLEVNHLEAIEANDYA